ncbi:TlpA disulfide reductase family protein [Nocardioides pantholopis]|uniref:TlpA disulfide reductase family protein n=1 Tax=Nocardioides pantholopis TaxID=2483798 RepID=UPI0013DE4600|nr:TlpA disulfide reductase family protein [Nocardioides pantholopis]
MRVRILAVVGLLLTALLCSCAPEADEPGDGESGGPSASNIDVDTPELRALKKRAGIEPCVPGPATDGGLPSLTLACLGGGPAVDLASLEGPLVLNYWYAACGPCRKEMPAVQDFYERYGDRVPVIGIDIMDVMPKAALELAEQTGARYPQLADPGGDLQGTDLRAIGYPTFAFLDADGETTMVGGGIESAEELVELVEEHLGIAL